jgi:hypothetical protein
VLAPEEAFPALEVALLAPEVRLVTVLTGFDGV